MLQSWIEEGLTPGVAAVVARDGRLVGELYAGSADGDRPVEAETLFCLSSITKLYTACAAMALVQDGLRALDESLADLLPERVEDDRSSLTLRRLLTHTSGLPLDLGPRESERLGPTPELEAILNEQVELRPVAPPGSQVRYSNVNYGLLARVVERAAGQSFAAWLQQRVFDPLDLSQTALSLPSESWERLARVADTEDAGSPQEAFNSAWWRSLGSPYAGATAPAREVARFLAAVLSESPIPGFLTPIVLEYMTHAQTGELSGGFGFSPWTRAEWGLGFELRGEKRLHPFGDLTSPETFGHLSLAGGMAWADPEVGLVCVVLTNRALAADRERRLANFCRFSNAVAAAFGQ